MRASCDPLAARQPISAAAITQMAMTANIVFCGEACTMKKTTGDDHSSDQATVRHGMNQRDSGRTLAQSRDEERGRQHGEQPRRAAPWDRLRRSAPWATRACSAGWR